MTQQPDDADLRAAIERVIAGHGGRPRRVVAVRRRPSACRTSFPIEEIDAELDDGTNVALVLKDPNRDALFEAARRAKPEFLHDAEREIEVYRSVFRGAPPGPPVCYGAVANPVTGRNRLLLERVAGRELYQVGEFKVWQEAARWVARLHARFVGFPGPPTIRLLTYDSEFYRRWPRRAAAFAPPEARRQVEWLMGRYERVVERLLALPPTLLHGEYYASNVIAQETPDGLRICPIDWEMAAWGPGLFDLAAIASGKWTDSEREALARAYHEALRAEGAATGSAKELLVALDWCRLHLAVQWIGWSDDWKPPAEHAHDWLGEAMRLAERIE